MSSLTKTTLSQALKSSSILLLLPILSLIYIGVILTMVMTEEAKAAEVDYILKDVMGL
jgi:fructose-specific phosphotransferase system IIC component